MAFIDRTYFATGELFIPGLDKDSVQEKLDYFISIHEPDCLRKLLGYEFFKLFTDGLNESSPEQKWIDLRDGVEFTGYNGRVKKWMGFTGLINAVPVFGGGFRPSEQIQADVTTGFVSDTTTVTFDGTSGKKDYRGYKMIPERISTGTMWLDEDYTWNAITGKWDLLKPGDKFQPLEKFNVTFEPYSNSSSSSSGTSVKQSLIANYVYYWYMREAASSTTGIGEALPVAENTQNANPAYKMQRAWMQLMDWVQELLEFMNQKRDDYPEFFYHSVPSLFRHTVNAFGI